MYVRELTRAEDTQLQSWAECSDPSLRHRAKVVLLSSEGYRVPEIGALVDAHPANLRKWIHRFNARGCDGLRTVYSGGPKRRFTSRQRAQIVELAKANPRAMGLRFSRWTLHKLAAHASELGLVDQISHECIRQILQEANCSYRGEGNQLNR